MMKDFDQAKGEQLTALSDEILADLPEGLCPCCAARMLAITAVRVLLEEGVQGRKLDTHIADLHDTINSMAGPLQ